MPPADISEKLQEQEIRQSELNHYVKMVLTVYLDAYISLCVAFMGILLRIIYLFVYSFIHSFTCLFIHLFIYANVPYHAMTDVFYSEFFVVFLNNGLAVLKVHC